MVVPSLILSIYTDTYESGNYLFVEFTSSATTMNSTVVHDGYSGSQSVFVQGLVIGTVPQPITQVTINGTAVPFYYRKPLMVRTYSTLQGFINIEVITMTINLV